MKDLVAKAGRMNEFEIISRATSREEAGNTPHRGTLAKCAAMNVPTPLHRSTQITVAEVKNADLVCCMDESNRRAVLRIAGDENVPKVRLLLDFAPENHARHEIADPYYTGDFDETYNDVLAGCQGLLKRF